MVDGCVRVLSTYREAVAETGPCGGVLLGLRLVQLNSRRRTAGEIFFFLVLVPCVSGGKAIWVAGGSQLRGRSSNKIPDQMLP